MVALMHAFCKIIMTRHIYLALNKNYNYPILVSIILVLAPGCSIIHRTTIKHYSDNQIVIK